MSWNDPDKEDIMFYKVVTNHEEKRKMEELAQPRTPLPPPPDPNALPGKEGSSLSHEELNRRANQLSGYLEQGDLMAIALNPSLENERLMIENYLGYFRTLLEGLASDADQAPDDPPLVAPNGKLDRKASPESE